MEGWSLWVERLVGGLEEGPPESRGMTEVLLLSEEGVLKSVNVSESALSCMSPPLSPRACVCGGGGTKTVK